MNNGNYFIKEDWPKMIQFLSEAMIKFEGAMKEYILAVKGKLKNREPGV